MALEGCLPLSARPAPSPAAVGQQEVSEGSPQIWFGFERVEACACGQVSVRCAPDRFGNGYGWGLGHSYVIAIVIVIVMELPQSDLARKRPLMATYSNPQQRAGTTSTTAQGAVQPDVECCQGWRVWPCLGCSVNVLLRRVLFLRPRPRSVCPPLAQPCSMP